MTMPGGPSAPMGAEGQLNVPGPIIEVETGPGLMCEPGDDMLAVPVGSQQHGPHSPTHGAAGGVDVNFTSVAPDLFQPTSTSTGMTTSHAALGGALAVDSGMKK